MIYITIKATLIWPISILVQLLVWIFAPLIAWPYIKELRTDKAKRVAEARGENRHTEYTLLRQYLLPWLRWAGSDDNAIDEAFWDGYIFTNVPIDYYNDNKILQYLARVYWVMRNPAMSFNRKVLGVKVTSLTYSKKKVIKLFGSNVGLTVWRYSDANRSDDPAIAFLLEADFGFKPFRNVKWGWKAHRSAPHALMYADRVISFGVHKESKWFRKEGA